MNGPVMDKGIGYWTELVRGGEIGSEVNTRVQHIQTLIIIFFYFPKKCLLPFSF